MAVATETKTDSQLKTDVENELRWEPRVNPNEIGVAVKDGVVTLTGWVDSYMKRYSAEEAAHRVRGVKAVAPPAARQSASETLEGHRRAAQLRLDRMQA